MTEDVLYELRQKLAEALAKAQELEVLYKKAESDWKAEIAPLAQERADSSKQAKELDSATRDAVRNRVEQTGFLPDMVGVGVQYRDDLMYDEDKMLAWAKANAPELLETRLKNKTYVHGWFKENATECVDEETGERYWVVDYVVNGLADTTLIERIEIPATPVKVPVPVISERGLLTWLDEQRWQAEQQAKAGRDAD